MKTLIALSILLVSCGPLKESPVPKASESTIPYEDLKPKMSCKEAYIKVGIDLGASDMITEALIARNCKEASMYKVGESTLSVRFGDSILRAQNNAYKWVSNYFDNSSYSHVKNQVNYDCDIMWSDERRIHNGYEFRMISEEEMRWSLNKPHYNCKIEIEERFGTYMQDSPITDNEHYRSLKYYKEVLETIQLECQGFRNGTCIKRK